MPCSHWQRHSINAVEVILSLNCSNFNAQPMLIGAKERRERVSVSEETGTPPGSLEKKDSGFKLICQCRRIALILLTFSVVTEKRHQPEDSFPVCYRPAWTRYSATLSLIVIFFPNATEAGKQHFSTLILLYLR